MALNFPTPAVWRRDKAKTRSFEIIEQEVQERLDAMQDGREVDDDFMSVVLGAMSDEDTQQSGDAEEMAPALKKTCLTLYGMIWAVRFVFRYLSILPLTKLFRP